MLIWRACHAESFFFVSNKMADSSWIPIDDLLNTATGEMSSGQLIHDDAFSLFNSMSAIQIMDPKMDVGMAPPEGEPPIKTTRQLVEEGRAPLHLSDADAVYVFDALLACEATWHTGQALATTVYTCIYMHDWERLEAAPNPVLRAYFEAVRCSCASVRHAVSSADIYEEEDFLLATSGFDLGFAAIGDPERRDVALAGLRAAETWLLEKMKSEGKDVGNKKVDHGGESEEAEAAAAAAAALLTRIRFRTALHTAMVHLFKPPSVEEAKAARACLEEAVTHLDDMRASLVHLPLPERGVVVVKTRQQSDGEGGGDDGGGEKSKESAGAGGAADEGEAMGGGDLDWDPNGLGFDRKVNLSKLGPVPPRVVKLHTRVAALDHFSDLIKQLKRVCDVATVHDSGVGALHEVLAMLSSMSDEDPGIVSRSFAAIAFFRGGLLGKHMGDAVLRSAWISGTTLPPVVDIAADGFEDEDDDLGGTGDSGRGGCGGDGDGSGHGGQKTTIMVGGGRPGGASGEDGGGGVEGGDSAARTGTVGGKEAAAVGADALRNFLIDSVRPVELLVRAYLANRSRLRRKLRRLLTEWVAVAERGGALDRTGFTAAHLAGFGEKNKAASEVLAQTPWAAAAFGSWASSVLVRIQLSHLTLGFNLQLYLPHELCMVYWYVEYLMQSLSDRLRMAEMSLAQESAAAKSFAAAVEGSAGGTGGKLRKKGGKQAGRGMKKSGGGSSGGSGGESYEVEDDGGASLLRVKMELYVLDVQKMMCKGLVRLLAALHAVDRGGARRSSSKNAFTEQEQNFWQRFGVFHVCPDPQPLRYEDFASYTALDGVVSPSQLLKMSADCFNNAREQVRQLLSLPSGIVSPEQARDLTGIDKVAAANGTATRLVEMPGVSVDFDYKHHPVFATVVVRRDKK